MTRRKTASALPAQASGGIRRLAIGIGAAGLLTVTVAQAQDAPPPPLIDFAQQQNTNSNLQNVATAVQVICPQLVGLQGGDSAAENVALWLAEDDPDLQTTRDLTLRCNELVITARNNLDRGEGGRDLMVEDADLVGSLQQVTAEEIGSQGTLTVRASNGQFANVAGRLDAIRIASLSSGFGSGAAAFNWQLDGQEVTASSLGLAEPLTGGGAAADSQRRWGWFLTGGYNTGDFDRDVQREGGDLEDSFDFDTLSATGGFDYRWDNFVLGAAIGYDDYDADIDSASDDGGQLVSGGSTDADGYSGSIFGLYFLNNFFIDGIVTVGKLDFDLERELFYVGNGDAALDTLGVSQTLDADTDADHYMLGLSVGYTFYTGAWMIEPQLAYSYRNVDVDGYTENARINDTGSSGGMNLRVDDYDIDSKRTIAGVQVSRNYSTSFGVLVPSARFDWYHEFEDDGQSIDAKYALEDELADELGGPFSSNIGFGSDGTANCLSCFRILTDDPEADYFVLGIALAARFKNGLQGFVGWDGLLGYDDLTSNAFTLGIRGAF